MEKELLKSKEQFKKFVNDHTGYQSFYGETSSYLDEPDRYPCILMWDIWDDSNGPAQLCGDFVYPDDFDEKVSDKSDVNKIYNFVKKDMQNSYYDIGDCERIQGYRDVLRFIDENIYKK